MKYKVCILAAGKGSRVSYSKIINKALLPVGDETALTRIINKFPEDIEFVIPVGYNAQQIKDFLAIAHPQRLITYVDVDNWDEPGSGPGYSLLSCKPHLDCPFIFTSCDTIVLEAIPEPSRNWIGVAKVLDSKDYCIAEVVRGRVSRFYDKIDTATLVKICEDFNTILDHAFIGMAAVHDHKIFWKALEGNKTQLIKNELQVSNGLNKLIEKNLFAEKFTWFDTGNEISYEYTNRYFNKNRVLLKDNEFIYFEDDKVIKYFANEQIVTNRLKRAKKLKGFVPDVKIHKKNYFAYNYVEGKMLSEITDRSVFKKLLQFFDDSLWKEVKIDAKAKKDFSDICMKFYKEKTESRVQDFFQKTGMKDRSEQINGVVVPSTQELFARVDWNNLCEGVPVLFHGDFQPENIIVADDGFVLLDWRQDFGGCTDYGDLYYDFAKLYHACIISGEMIRKNEFNIDIKADEVTFNFLVKRNLVDLKKTFIRFINEKGYDLRRVRLLTSLIYLNIAPFHHDPYNKLVYFLGKNMLNDILEEKDGVQND